MILYNVTINIDPDIHQEWLAWMKIHHIPKVMDTGCFIENKIFKVLTVEAGEGFTYSVQYMCNSMKEYELYSVNFASELQKEHTEKYKDRFVAFRSLLEKI